MKSGQTIRDALALHGYTYCFIDDFYTADAYAIKTKTIQTVIQTRIDERMDFNVKDMLNDVMKSTWLEMTEKEKTNFYNLHLKPMQLQLDKDRNVKIVLE